MTKDQTCSCNRGLDISDLVRASARSVAWDAARENLPAIEMRATESFGLHQQKVGRAFRPIPPSRAQAAGAIIREFLDAPRDTYFGIEYSDDLIARAEAWLAEAELTD